MSTLAELERARAFMDEHWDQPLSLDEIAQRVHLSRYHFIRLFQRAFYATPHQYLIHKRVEKAKQLLAQSELSVTDICFAVGFASLGSFSTLFHKVVGWSPSIYRARVWEQQRNPYKFIPGCVCTMYNLTPATKYRSENLCAEADFLEQL